MKSKQPSTFKQCESPPKCDTVAPFQGLHHFIQLYLFPTYYRMNLHMTRVPQSHVRGACSLASLYLDKCEGDATPQRPPLRAQVWSAFPSLLQIAELLFGDDQASEQSGPVDKASLKMLLNGTFVPTVLRKKKKATAFETKKHIL